MESNLYRWTDGQVITGTDEFYMGADPMQWDGDGFGDPAVVFYYEPTGSNIMDFTLSPENMTDVYNLIKEDFLPEYVAANLDKYCDLDCESWRTQDENP